MPITLKNNNAGIGDVRAFGGQERLLTAKFSFAANYATGGEAIDFTKYLDGREPTVVIFEPTNGYAFRYNPSTKKVMAYSAATTEVTAGTNLTALVIPFIAIAIF
jgi:hypothetical protein